jgi:carbonic anhydrase/acetyltransferase-like protein (isoleucine patch superfamily)
MDMMLQSFVSENAVLDASHGIIRIGERTYIGPHVHIKVSSEQHNDNDNEKKKKEKKPVCVIGSGVWVGDRTQLHNCWIGPGARIGMDTRIDTDVVVQEKAHVEHGSWITEGTTVPNNAYYCDR